MGDIEKEEIRYETLGAHSQGVIAVTASAGGGHEQMGLLSDELSREERQVLYFILDRFLNEGDRDFGAKEIRKATGVVLTPEMRGRVLAAVYGEILRDALPGGANLATIDGCGACPSRSDISLPTLEDIDRMGRDLIQDGIPLEGFLAPELNLKDLRGDRVKLERFHGRPLAIAFWSPTCAHSLRAMAELQRLEDRYGETDLAVLGVVFSDEDRRSLIEFVNEQGIDLPILVCKDGKLRVSYQANLVPTVVLIDREGNLVKRLVGFRDAAELEAEIAGLF